MLVIGAGVALAAASRCLAIIPLGLVRLGVALFAALVERDSRRSDNPAPLHDLHLTLAHDPVGAQAIRRMLRRARWSQLVAVLRGYLAYHLSARPTMAPVCREKGLGTIRHPRRGALTVAVVGPEDRETARLAEHYRTLAGVTVGAAANCAALPAGIDAVELGPLSGATATDMTALLGRGIAVSASYQLIDDSAAARCLCAAAARHTVPLRIFYPHLYYQPLWKVRELLANDVVGEVTTIRLRATCGGPGATWPPAPIERQRFFHHPAFDHFLLLRLLGGEAAAVTGYLSWPAAATADLGLAGTGPADTGLADTGLVSTALAGTGLADVRLYQPGRYALLDCSAAPQMHLTSAHFPYDLEAEIAGSDGIIWLTRFMAQRTQVAPIAVRVGRRAFTIGVESTLALEWDSVYRGAAEHLCELLRGCGRSLVSSAELFDALVLRESAERACEASKAVVVCRNR
jgi:predicted dehydrogenase